MQEKHKKLWLSKIKLDLGSSFFLWDVLDDKEPLDILSD